MNRKLVVPIAASLVVMVLAPQVVVAETPTPPPATTAPYAPPPGHSPESNGPDMNRPIPTPPPVPPERLLGIGFKIGNGLGFTGADIIIVPANHLGFDLQANYFSVATPSGTARGFGFAPAVQFRFRSGMVSTPYIGLGYVYAQVALEDVVASASGVFLNGGYQWRWSSGFGLLLGGGVGYLAGVHATDGRTRVDVEGGPYPNLEFSVRYMLF